MSDDEFRQVVEKELDNFSYAVMGQYASEDMPERIDAIMEAKKTSDQQIALAAQRNYAIKGAGAVLEDLIDWIKANNPNLARLQRHISTMIGSVELKKLDEATLNPKQGKEL